LFFSLRLDARKRLRTRWWAVVFPSRHSSQLPNPSPSSPNSSPKALMSTPSFLPQLTRPAPPPACLALAAETSRAHLLPLIIPMDRHPWFLFLALWVPPIFAHLGPGQWMSCSPGPFEFRLSWTSSRRIPANRGPQGVEVQCLQSLSHPSSDLMETLDSLNFGKRHSPSRRTLPQRVTRIVARRMASVINMHDLFFRFTPEPYVRTLPASRRGAGHLSFR
jgi:hypothetical protein